MELPKVLKYKTKLGGVSYDNAPGRLCRSSACGAFEDKRCKGSAGLQGAQPGGKRSGGSQDQARSLHPG